MRAFNGRAPYNRGYAFETRARQALEALGWHVERRHKSAFPDLTCLPVLDRTDAELAQIPDWRLEKLGAAHQALGSTPLFVECKVGGKLSKQERERFVPLMRHARCLMAYPEKLRGKVTVVFADAQTGVEVFRT